MRELVFKNLTSENRRKKDLYITETVETSGVKTITRRHSVYIVSDHNKFKNPKELLKYKDNTSMNYTKRHVFIFKKQDTKHKKESFVCDVVGKFYAVVKSDIYSIAFKHSFEIDFLTINNK